jgi:hypothetical protein
MRRFSVASVLMACSAFGQVYDLKNDWSDTQNPNGVWQYRAGTKNLVHAADWTGALLGYTQPVWTTTATPGPGEFLPAIFKAVSTRLGDDYSVGDIVMHSNSPGNGNDIDVANVAWTSPSNATINISGSLWQTALHSGPMARNNSATLRLNGVVLQTMPNLQSSSSSAPASILVTNLPVRQGDVVTLNVVRDLLTDGYLVDVNLHIVASLASTTMILPQLAFGGGWYSALYFTNTTNSPLSFPVNMIADDGTPLNVPSLNGSSATVSLAPRGTAILEAPNLGSLNQGYVSAALPTGVTGYGVFRQSAPGRPDQEAVVPLSSSSSTTSTLVWDDTNFTTAVALVNPSSVSVAVTIVVRDASGTTIGTATLTLDAKKKVPVVLRDVPGLGAMAGNRGSADFTVALGNLAVLGLRFGGAAFTSIPTLTR